MIRVEVTEPGLVIHVPRREALLFSSLVEASLQARSLSPSEADFRQQAVAAVVQATADLLRARHAPRPGEER
jgi:hypothetical protein